MAAKGVLRAICGYKSLKIILLLMNCLYIMLSLILIALLIPLTLLYYSVGVAAPIGLVACVLFIVAIVGIVAVVLHHQVVLFFYMIFIGLVGLFLLATSIAAAAFADQLTAIGFKSTWRGLTCDQKTSLQNYLDCCGLDNEHKGGNYSNCGHLEYAHPQCGNSPVLTSGGHCCFARNNDEDNDCPNCLPCLVGWQGYLSAICRAVAAFGIIFALSKIAAVVISYRYRNLKNPSADPTDYL